MPLRPVFTARRHLLAGSLVRAFHGASLLGRYLPYAQPQRHGLQVQRDVAWREPVAGDSRAHLLDVWSPGRMSGALPVVLYLHGGGFRGLSKDTHWVMAVGFARAGYLVFNVNYRLAPQFPFPAGAEDACAAFAWVVENAARFGGDPRRIVVAGESAGANLSAVVGVATSWRRPEPFARQVFDLGVQPMALSPACGILQVSRPQRFRDEAKTWWFQQDVIDNCFHVYIGPNEDMAPERGLADPLLIFEGDDPPDRPLPPFFLGCGTADPILGDTRRLEKALKKRGVHHEAQYYPGGVHAFQAFYMMPQARKFHSDQLRFLAEVGGAPDYQLDPPNKR
jgi:acetyl esterase